MKKTIDPLKEFQQKLVDFAAKKRRGIRNPFVIVPVDPPYEQRMTDILSAWDPTVGNYGIDSDAKTIPVKRIYLDQVLPQTEVYRTVVSIPQTALEAAVNARQNGNVTEYVEETMRDNLASEVVRVILDEHPDIREVERQIVLLLNLGSLYPFARASELLDEFDRHRAQSTIGIPFPGSVIGGKLAFFGEDARHYYPAHRIDQQIKRGHLQ